MLPKAPILLLLLMSLTAFSPGEFKSDQLRYQRVRDAYATKEATVDALLKPHNINRSNMEVFFRGFKEEMRFQVFARNKGDAKYTLVKEYNFCMLSGKTGPKRKQGDGQVPEGFYHVDRFNPASNFHLSLGINYPNASDRILSDKRSPGGDIFIHGSCVSIGCIPLTDDLIKEVYLFAVEARDNGQTQIPVHIFPFNFGVVPKSEWENCEGLQELWADLKTGYTAFETSGAPAQFSVDAKGRYQF